MDLLTPRMLEAIDDPAAAVGFLAAAVVGVASSFHCFLMCGPLACAGLAPRAAPPSDRVALPRADAPPRPGRWAPIAAYQLVRLSAYALLGGLLGASGDAIARTLALSIRPWLPWVMVAMLVAAALDLGRHLPAIPGLRRLSARLGRSSARLSPVARSAAIGAFTPLLPCGLVYAVMTAALLAGSLGGGALVGAGFALGSAPALLAAQAGVGLWRRMPRPAAVALRRGIPMIAALGIAWRAIRLGSGGACH